MWSANLRLHVCMRLIFHPSSYAKDGMLSYKRLDNFHTLLNVKEKCVNERKIITKKFRCYEAKKRPAASGNQTQDTSGLSRQCSATELRQPDNLQPSQSSSSMYCAGGSKCLSRTSGSHNLFTFFSFRLITSKFLYFQHETSCSEQKNYRLKGTVHLHITCKSKAVV